jgi:peptidoglycan/LPS O-acetylase OafA/YrhL
VGLGATVPRPECGRERDGTDTLGQHVADGRVAERAIVTTTAPSTTTAPVRYGPIPSLDGLRAIAVLIVLVSHAGYGEVIPGGLGVTIFFFLSGYLITTLLLDERRGHGSVNVGHFYLRRAFRLLPPLVVTLVIAYTLVGVGALGGGTSWTGLASQLFYFANYFQIFGDAAGRIPDGTNILWSLAVEEHFYIVYPALMFVALKLMNARRVLIVSFAVLCVLVLAWRLWLVSRPDFTEMRTYYATDTRFDSILFGCLLALWRNPARLPAGSERTTMRPVDWTLLGGGLALLLSTLVYRQADFRETFRYSIQGIALMPIFYYAIRFPTVGPFRVLSLRWLARIGVLSYGIYLSHYIVLDLVSKNVDIDIPSPLRVVIALGVASAYAALLDRYLDPYFRRRRAALH